ncbi:MAG: LamG-like jellyroll fold domain-containing protein [Dehalococcoidia bacterium]
MAIDLSNLLWPDADQGRQPASSSTLSQNNPLVNGLTLCVEANIDLFNPVNGHIENNIGGFQYLPTPVGMLPNLNGSSQYISIQVADFKAPTSGNWTYAVTASVGFSGIYPFISAWDGSGSGRNIYFYFSSGLLRVDVPYLQAVLTASPPSANVPHRYHITNVANAVTLYIDGKAAATAALTATLEAPTTATTIGATVAGTAYMSGQIGRVRAWNRALSANEVMLEISNPLFAPPIQNIYPVQVATGVSVNLTGQSAAFTAGTITPAVALGLTGQLGNFTAGTVTPAVAVALTGQQANFTAGTVSYSAATNVTVTLTGQLANFTAGMIVPELDIALTGQQANFTAGTIVYAGDVNVSLTGQQAIFTAGNVSYSGPVPPGGPAIHIRRLSRRRWPQP